jgi:peptidoglycan/LPS O-acetylase OafA/YrhL
LVLLLVPPILVTIVLARDGNVARPRLSEFLRRVGLVSYSLYLWNTLATLQPVNYGSPTFRLLALLAIPFAWISYRYIEKPFIAMGKRWSEAIIARRTPLAGRSKQYATAFLHDSP